jgi:hypothetical protein
LDWKLGRAGSLSMLTGPQRLCPQSLQAFPLPVLAPGFLDFFIILTHIHTHLLF